MVQQFQIFYDRYPDPGELNLICTKMTYVGWLEQTYGIWYIRNDPIF